jgi:hypothetical protein
VSTGSVLSAHDCFELGRQSYNSGDADHTVQVPIFSHKYV